MSGCKKALTMILAFALSITTLAGCQSGSQSISSAAKSESPNQPIVLKHWFWPDSDMHTQVMQSMVNDFNATNGKNIKVELEIHPWDGGQYSQNLFRRDGRRRTGYRRVQADVHPLVYSQSFIGAVGFLH